MLATKQQVLDAILYENLRAYYPGDLLQDAGELCDLPIDWQISFVL